MVQACCQRACIAWGEVPICGSMWRGGSKSPLMNQYVGGLSLWWGCPRNATLHPGKNVCICRHQTLFMAADNLNLNGSSWIRAQEIWTQSQTPFVITCMNETEEDRLKAGTEWALTFRCIRGKKLLRSYIRHLKKQEGTTLVLMSNELNLRQYQSRHRNGNIIQKQHFLN